MCFWFPPCSPIAITTRSQRYILRLGNRPPVEISREQERKIRELLFEGPELAQEEKNHA